MRQTLLTEMLVVRVRDLINRNRYGFVGNNKALDEETCKLLWRQEVHCAKTNDVVYIAMSEILK
jgi:hypothetical protein